MTLGRIALAASVLALAACASHGKRIDAAEGVERSSQVNQRMLLPNATAGAAQAIPEYEMRPLESFRMPQALNDATPQLPTDSPRSTLAPTTVCVRAVVSAQGQVQRVDALNDRDECAAGVVAENADLLQAVRQRLLQWTFAPAAVCTWNAGAQASGDDGECTGAAKIEPVPVSLLYAFTFEIREGKASVRGGRAPQP